MADETDQERLVRAQETLARLDARGATNGRRQASDGFTGSTGNSVRTPKPVRKVTVGTGKSVSARPGTDEGYNSDNAYAPRPSSDTLGTVREEHGGIKQVGGRVARAFRGTDTGDRPTSGQTVPVDPEDTLFHWLSGTGKRILAYAGFDVQSDAMALNEEEVEKYTPIVARFIGNVGIAMDYIVTHTNKEHAESYIWVMDEEECTVLARIYLKRAKKIGWMAEVARQVQHVEDLGDGKDIAKIVGKRLLATGAFYQSAGGITRPWLR